MSSINLLLLFCALVVSSLSTYLPPQSENASYTSTLAGIEHADTGQAGLSDNLDFQMEFGSLFSSLPVVGLVVGKDIDVDCSSLNMDIAEILSKWDEDPTLDDENGMNCGREVNELTVPQESTVDVPAKRSKKSTLVRAKGKTRDRRTDSTVPQESTADVPAKRSKKSTLVRAKGKTRDRRTGSTVPQESTADVPTKRSKKSTSSIGANGKTRGRKADLIAQSKPHSNATQRKDIEPDAEVALEFPDVQSLPEFMERRDEIVKIKDAIVAKYGRVERANSCIRYKIEQSYYKYRPLINESKELGVGAVLTKYQGKTLQEAADESRAAEMDSKGRHLETAPAISTAEEFIVSWTEYDRIFDALPRPLLYQEEIAFCKTYHSFIPLAIMLKRMDRDWFLRCFGGVSTIEAVARAKLALQSEGLPKAGENYFGIYRGLKSGEACCAVQNGFQKTGIVSYVVEGPPSLLYPGGYLY
jgi:hypothetical protein